RPCTADRENHESLRGEFARGSRSRFAACPSALRGPRSACVTRPTRAAQPDTIARACGRWRRSLTREPRWFGGALRSRLRLPRRRLRQLTTGQAADRLAVCQTGSTTRLAVRVIASRDEEWLASRLGRSSTLICWD